MTTWFNLIAIAGGGALGSVARYLITLAAIAVPGGSSMIGTTIANVLGCAAIGGLIEYTAVEGMMAERVRLALQVGFLGGLTTFSTFSSESASLAIDGRLTASTAYVAANMVLGWIVLIGAAEMVKGWNA
ncbi:putative fluoride ion transporter CrcB [Rubripirellula tenax]|uniref:Fluoride-specific ion channel FluC n=1 Tax=Rubripirellula tenax TaxID=2528015 RepID=A0A5C6F5Q9_9BACT|nr:CrcB family protein [Rubripirellula tenax]TWU57043.1 putative fluoride ion transporter CrcB [Rubripirellula tenax]